MSDVDAKARSIATRDSIVPRSKSAGKFIVGAERIQRVERAFERAADKLGYPEKMSPVKRNAG
jgi:hypothetical protein